MPPLNLAPASTLEGLYSACDPEEDLEGGKAHPYYVDLATARGPSSVTARIRRTINLSTAAEGPSRDAHCKLLLTGHRGTGKTTELNSLASELGDDGYFVVRLAGQSEFNLNDLAWQDLLLELAYQVFDQGELAHSMGELPVGPDEALLKNIERWLEKTSLTEIAKTSGEIEACGEIGVGAPISWLNLRASLKSLWRSGSERTRQVRKDLEPRATQLITDLNAFLEDFNDKLRRHEKKGLVVIIDGLEKMALNVSDAGCSCHVDLFVNHSDNLKAPRCHIVYTMPISLLYDHNLGECYPRMEPFLLPMVRVKKPSRDPHPDGIRLMHQLLSKRGDVDRLVDRNALDVVIRMSGGHVRDLLRLVRAACVVALEADEASISEHSARSAIENFAMDAYSRMAYEASAELAEVYRTQHLSKRHGHLAQNLLVLEYRNGEAWNDVHPCLLTLKRIRAAVGID
jgi:hypothetical protein